MKRIILFTCIFGLLFLSYSYAEDYSDKPLSGGVFLGGRAMNGPQSGYFNQYNGIAPGLFGGGDIQYNDKSGYYFGADGAILGDDDMYIKARGGKWGSFKFSLYYTEFPHNLSFQNQSLFATPGSQNQTFTGNGSATGVTNLNRWGSLSFDYKVRRKDAGGSFDLNVIKPFFISVEANRLERTGQIPWAGTSGQAGFKAVEFALPIDNTTTNISALAGWKNKQYYVALGGGYSRFTNDAEFTTFRDPFTTGSIVSNGVAVAPPDNKSWNLKFTGTAKLPLSSTFALTAGYTRNTSETNILNSIDALGGNVPLTLNRTIFHGDVKFWNVNAALTSNPWKSLNTKLYFNYLDKRNDDDPVAFTTAAGSSGGDVFTYSKTSLGAEASYRFLKNLKGILGYDFTDTRRRVLSVNEESAAEAGSGFIAHTFQYPDTWDNKVTAQLVYNPADWLGTRLKYQKLYRGTSFRMEPIDPSGDVNTAFSNAQADQTQRFDIGKREQDMVKLTVDLMPIQNLDVALEYAYKRDHMPKDALGFQDMNRNEFILDASYTWKDFKFFAFFDYDSSYTNQFSRQSSGAVGQPSSIFAASTTTNFNWNADLHNDNYAYGIGGVVPILKKRLSLIVQYDFEKNNGAADFTSQNFTAATAALGVNNTNISMAPWDDYTRQSLSARLVFAATKDLGLTLGYMYSQFRLNDSQLNGYSNVPLSPAGVPQNLLLSGAYTDQNYNVNLFYLKAMYKF